MKALIAMAVVVAVLAAAGETYAQKYIGRYSANPYAPDSTGNAYGTGSPYNPDSINNPYGAGSRYRTDSPNNPFGWGLDIIGQ